MRIEDGGARFRKTVRRCEVHHAEFVDHSLHQPFWDWAACYDTSPQLGGPAFGLGEIDNGFHHGWHAVQCCTSLVGDGVERCDGVKGLGGVYDTTAMGNGCEKTKRQAKAVEKRRWAAECVVGSKLHAVADEAGVVDEVAVSTLVAVLWFGYGRNVLMCEHRCLRIASTAAGKL